MFSLCKGIMCWCTQFLFLVMMLAPKPAACSYYGGNNYYNTHSGPGYWDEYRNFGYGNQIGSYGYRYGNAHHQVQVNFHRPSVSGVVHTPFKPVLQTPSVWPPFQTSNWPTASLDGFGGSFSQALAPGSSPAYPNRPSYPSSSWRPGGSSYPNRGNPSYGSSTSSWPPSKYPISSSYPSSGAYPGHGNPSWSLNKYPSYGSYPISGNPSFGSSWTPISNKPSHQAFDYLWPKHWRSAEVGDEDDDELLIHS